MSDYQGKKPKQVKDSENTATFALICLIISIIAAAVVNFL
jgi:hypothetical protein